jgi:hypothetical protein
MEDKRGIKQDCSSSTEGSPVPSDANTPPLASSGSPSPLGSPSEVASCRPRSSVFEQGGPSGKAPMIDLSSASDEDDFIADTSRDFEFTQWLYGELNRGFLEPPGDGKIIILSDSDEEKEDMHEEKSSSPKGVAASSVVNPASTASTGNANTPIEKSSTLATSPADADEDPRRHQMMVVMVWPRVRRWGRTVKAETKPVCLRLPRQEWRLWQACFEESYI